MGDIGLLVNQVAADPMITRKNGLFIIPSISATVWTPEDVWNTGIVSTYTDSLYGLAVERYVSIYLSPVDDKLIVPHLGIRIITAL